MRLVAQRRDEPAVVHPQWLPPQVTHLAHLAQGRDERRGQGHQPPGEGLDARLGARAARDDALNSARHLRPVGVPVPGHVEAGERVQPVAALQQFDHRAGDVRQVRPLVADAGLPRMPNRCDRLPGPEISPCENQLLPALRSEEVAGPDNQHAARLRCEAIRKRRSSSTRIAPFRVCGCCGESSLTTGNASGPKFRVLPQQFSLPLDTWITMHEDLRQSPRCRVTFDALVEGLRRHAG